MNELEDSPHFPTWLRNFQTEFIGFVVIRFSIYQAFINYIKSLSLTQQPMTDLCSGSGEPAVHIFQESNCFSHLILTDKFPNKISTSNLKISYLSQSMDVLEMKFQPGVCYTMFNAFHHFKDEDKLKIAQNMLASGSRSFFVEILEPNIFFLVKILFMTTIGNLLLTPLVKPFSFKRLFFTYIIPVNILTISYDGIVSVLKSRTVEGYRKLFIGHGDKIKIIKLRNNFNSMIIIQVEPK
ncbi:MAG: hypothetical protein M3R25_05740 [Bacteroidota bacterium]|nr:hypothetical protein [Bacteroidota bacterium]